MPSKRPSTRVTTPASTTPSLSSTFPVRLTNFRGSEVRAWSVSREPLTVAESASPRTAHHIVALDCSGSMYGQLDAVKSQVEKVLTLQEAGRADMLVSVISFSSDGDVRTHAERVRVSDLLAPNSVQLREIRSLNVRGMTGVSQALRRAKELARGSEITCISLHSDGYANDPSPAVEQRALRMAIEDLRKVPGTYVNTIAYSYASDFPTMNELARLGGGKCVVAQTAAQVAAALEDTQRTLSGSLAPTLEVGRGAADLLLVALSDGRVLSSSRETNEDPTLRIEGLPQNGTGVVFRAMQGSLTEDADSSTDAIAFLLAYAKDAFARGQLDRAKFALVSSKVEALREGYILRALTGPDLANAVSTLNGYLAVMLSVTPGGKMTALASGQSLSIVDSRALPSFGPTLLDFAAFVNKHHDALAIDADHLYKGYRRTGIKNIDGTREKDGSITPPRVESVNRDGSGWLSVNSISTNQDSANLNVLTSQPIGLVNAKTKKPISEVEGVKLLDLQAYRNFSLVVDGSVRVDTLRVRASTPTARKALAKFGPVGKDGVCDVSLGEMPVVSFEADIPRVERNDVRAYFAACALRKIVGELAKQIPAGKGDTKAYTAEQVAALADVYVSPKLYFNPPSTVPYTDLKKAIAEGTIDTRVSYRVQVGSPGILSVSELPSANEFLKRRFELVNADGTKSSDEPTFARLTQKGVVVRVKTLTKATKLTAIDDLLFPLYTDLLGLHVTRDMPIASLASNFNAGLGEKVASALSKWKPGQEVPAVMASVLAQIEEAIDDLLDTKIRPLVFSTGATGLLPDGYSSTGKSADDLKVQFPLVKISKDQKDGTFFVQDDDVIVSVFPETVYYSTGREPAPAPVATT